MYEHPVEPIEKPQNGIAGLRHLRHDILAGIVVSLVSLPLSSGIAIASGVPPIVGLISAIVAGFVFPFVGGAHVTIAGPAAGLAPAILAVLISLGGAGDADHLGEGYPYLLCVIAMVGCIQIIASLLKLARFAALIPNTVVEGMLASIGLLIIVKQLPNFFGFTGEIRARQFIEFVGDVPTYASGLSPRAFLVAIASLVLLFVLGSLRKIKTLQVIPPQLVAVVFGVILGQFVNVGEAGPGFLVKLPEDPFQGIQAPNFSQLLMRSDLWQAVIAAVVMLTMIDGIESLATAMAVDCIDPYHRKSDPNRVLLAMGISNVASSMVGGLTIIPGGVKSKANIAAGGRTLWSNFANAVCLSIYLLIGSTWINMIPLGVLASVLIYTGWKMCEPLIWRHIAHIGREQVVIFSFTIVVTLLTDLLVGIAAGVVAKYILDLLLCRYAIATTTSAAMKHLSTVQCMGDFFRNPVYNRDYCDGIYRIYINKPLVCFNSMQLAEEIDEIPSDARAVQVHLTESVTLIDRTAAENLKYTIQEYSQSNVPVEIVGMEKLVGLSHYDACVRIASARY